MRPVDVDICPYYAGDVITVELTMHLNVQAVQLFTSVLLDSAGIDYHVVLAQNALHQCLTLTELQPELLCALIKQTSRIQSQPQATTKRSAAQVNRPVSHLQFPRRAARGPHAARKTLLRPATLVCPFAQ